MVISVSLYAQLGFTQKGKASYYADKFHGRPTASGERYDRSQLTAAHKTLAFNSIIKVTNIHNGKSVIVRINDRGPFSKNRIIDVSYNAAKEIGILASGVGDVKIEVIGLNGKTNGTQPVAEKKEENSPQKSPENPETNPKISSEKPPVPKNNHPDSSKHPEKIEPATPEPKHQSEGSFKKNGIYNLDGSHAKISGWGIQLGAFRDIENAIQLAETAKQKGYSRVYIWVLIKKKTALYKVVLGNYTTKNIAKNNIIEINTKNLAGTPIEYPN